MVKKTLSFDGSRCSSPGAQTIEEKLRESRKNFFNGKIRGHKAWGLARIEIENGQALEALK